jgi:Family of unknown function (DUF5681)
MNSLNLDSLCIICDNSEMVHENSLANLKPFQKGQSGNPGGRPSEIKRLLSRLEVPSIEALAARIVERQDLAAATYVLDQLHGKATQRIESTTTIDWPTQAAKILVILQKHTYTHNAIEELKAVLLGQQTVVDGSVVDTVAEPAKADPADQLTEESQKLGLYEPESWQPAPAEPKKD